MRFILRFTLKVCVNLQVWTTWVFEGYTKNGRALLYALRRRRPAVTPLGDLLSFSNLYQGLGPGWKKMEGLNVDNGRLASRVVPYQSLPTQIRSNTMCI